MKIPSVSKCFSESLNITIECLFYLENLSWKGSQIIYSEFLFFQLLEPFGGSN